jgi:hypothetical protein
MLRIEEYTYVQLRESFEEGLSPPIFFPRVCEWNIGIPTQELLGPGSHRRRHVESVATTSASHGRVSSALRRYRDRDKAIVPGPPQYIYHEMHPIIPP